MSAALVQYVQDEAYEVVAQHKGSLEPDVGDLLGLRIGAAVGPVGMTVGITGAEV